REQDDARSGSGVVCPVRASRLLIVMGVLALGLAAALPFRHSGMQLAGPKSRSAPLDLTLRRADDSFDSRATAGVSPAVGLDALASAANSIAWDSSNIPRASDPAVVAPPPGLPIRFEPTPATDLQRTNDWRPGTA